MEIKKNKKQWLPRVREKGGIVGTQRIFREVKYSGYPKSGYMSLYICQNPQHVQHQK